MASTTAPGITEPRGSADGSGSAPTQLVPRDRKAGMSMWSSTNLMARTGPSGGSLGVARWSAIARMFPGSCTTWSITGGSHSTTASTNDTADQRTTVRRSGDPDGARRQARTTPATATAPTTATRPR
jgi:hypothetical protein